MLLRRVSLISILFVVLGGVGTVAFAEQTPEIFQLAQQSPRNRPDNGDRLMRELNLSQEQMQQIQAIRQKYQGQMQQQRQSLRQAQQELQQLMAADTPINQIRDKHRQVQQLRTSMAELQFENTLEMREVLTMEQRRLLNQRMQQRRENRSGSGTR